MSATGYPLASSSWDEEEIQAMYKVIESGMFTMGKHVSEFERGFADYTGSRYCVMCNSGSSANLLMVAALRYRRNDALAVGDEVIVPAVSWSTTYYPLYQYGLKLRFVDIDPRTLNFDLEALAAAITEKTRAILAVNLLGNPNDFACIQRLIGERSIILLEDNCESMGATFSGKQAGTFGLMGSYSAFFSHHISTMEGGMVVTDDEELHHIMLSLRAHGWTRNLPEFNRVCGSKSANAFEESFRFVLPGYNLRPLELSGAIGLCQLKKLPDLIRVRRENAERFIELMNNYPWLRVQQEIGQSSWFGFSLVVEAGAPITRSDLLATLTQRRIDVRPIVAGNFAKNEVLKWFEYSVSGELPNANDIDTNGLFIGNHHYALDGEFDSLRAALNLALQLGGRS